MRTNDGLPDMNDAVEPTDVRHIVIDGVDVQITTYPADHGSLGEVTVAVLLAPDTNKASEVLAGLSVSDFLAVLEKYAPNAPLRLAVHYEVFVDEADDEIFQGDVPEDEREAARERINAAIDRGGRGLWSPDAPADDRIEVMDYALAAVRVAEGIALGVAEPSRLLEPAPTPHPQKDPTRTMARRPPGVPPRGPRRPSGP
jgi:hypothetical protein